MKRKVLQVGKSSLAVSLPSKWAKAQGLKPGDEVEVDQRFDTLVLSGHIVVTGDELDMHITEGTVSFLRSMISTTYKKGYDLLRVHYENPDVIIKLQKIVDGLIGYEIVEQRQKSCIIKNIAQALESECETFLKKSFYMTLTMAEVCYEDLEGRKSDRFEEVQQTKENITKYTNLVKRLVSKKRRTERTMIFEYLTVWCLEKIANEYLYIYRNYALFHRKKVDSITLDVLKKATDSLRNYFRGFFKKENELVRSIADFKDGCLYGDMQRIYLTAKREDAILLQHIFNIIRRTYDMVGPYFGINL